MKSSAQQINVIELGELYRNDSQGWFDPKLVDDLYNQLIGYADIIYSSEQSAMAADKYKPLFIDLYNADTYPDRVTAIGNIVEESKDNPDLLMLFNVSPVMGGMEINDATRGYMPSTVGSPVTNRFPGQRASQTTDTDVEAWFNGSKVVDGNGKPMVVYHITDKDFTTFEHGDIGFHFGDKGTFDNMTGAVESSYDRYESDTDPYVFRAYLRINNPMYTNRDPLYWDEVQNLKNAFGSDSRVSEEFTDGTIKTPQDFVSVLKSKGYDGIIYDNEYEGGKSYIVFDNSQIYVIDRPQLESAYNDDMGIDYYKIPERNTLQTRNKG